MSHRVTLALVTCLLLLSLAASTPAVALENASAAAEPATPGDFLRITITPESQVVQRGGTAEFTVVVLNTSNNVNLTNVNVSAPSAPDCSRNIGNLAADSNYPPYPCLVGNVQTAFTNTVTATGRDPVSGEEDSANDSAEVEVMALDVSLEATPNTLPEPGGLIGYEVTVTNSGSLPVRLTSLSSPQYGDLYDEDNDQVQDNTCVPNGQPPLLTPFGDSTTCSFSALRTGQPGVYTTVVTAVARNLFGNNVSGSGEAEVELTDEAAAVALTLTANPTEVTAPGGNINFLVRFANQSSVDTVSLLGLEDSLKGALSEGNSTCMLPRTLAPGAAYECSYDYELSGRAGKQETHVLTATAEDDDDPANALTPRAEATVRVVAPPEYKLFLATVADAADEPNGNCENAFPLSLNTPYYFFANDRQDWYYFDLSQRGNAVVELRDFIPAAGQVVVYRDCDANRRVGFSPITQKEVTRIPLGTQPSGRYFIGVINDGNFNTQTPYRLNVSFE